MAQEHLNKEFGSTQVVAQDAQPTMSSREIADLVESRHDKVKQSIERLVERGVIVQPPMGDEQFQDSKGRPRSEATYRLSKRDSYIVVAQLSPEFTARLVDRWQELESGAAFDPMRTLNDPAAMRGILLSYTEKVLALEAVNAALTPKADALDRLAEAEGSFCVTDAAKTLQVQPKVLFTFLRSHGWIYSRIGMAGDVAYQAKIVSGLLEHKTTTVHRSDGSEKVATQVRVTPKGLARLAMELAPVVRVVASRAEQQVGLV